MFLMPGMIIALYTCGQLDKVRWGCWGSSSSSSSRSGKQQQHIAAADPWHD
jgi:hypothetical protein